MNTLISICALVIIAVLFFLQYNSYRISLRDAQGKTRANEEELNRLREENITLKQENARLAERLKLTENQLIANQENFNKQLAYNNADQERQAEKFKVLASEIITSHTDRFKIQSENRLTELLMPLKGELDQFRKAISECYSAEARERFSLQERIKELIETNQSIGKEAKDLTTALRTNSKTQGNWGEMILENILEKSGLRRGEEFIVQQTKQEGDTIRNEAGNMLRPDVVVNYPDGRVVVIDSKVSLTAFIDYINSTTPEETESAGKRHLESVKNHINELAKKEYQEYVGRDRTDFVMMFIPNESAYIAAMTLDNTLWQQAYDKRVLIVSPTHLISALRLISMLWSHDRQTKNAIDIADQSGKMYDKFVGFIEDMEKIEKDINNLSNSYRQALNKLANGTGNLVSRAEKLRELGAKTKKQLSRTKHPQEPEIKSIDTAKND